MKVYYKDIYEFINSYEHTQRWDKVYPNSKWIQANIKQEKFHILQDVIQIRIYLSSTTFNLGTCKFKGRKTIDNTEFKPEEIGPFFQEIWHCINGKDIYYQDEFANFKKKFDEFYY